MKYAVDMLSRYDAAAGDLLEDVNHCGITRADIGFVGTAAWLETHWPGVLDEMEAWDKRFSPEHAASRDKTFSCVRKIVEGTCPLYYVKA